MNNSHIALRQQDKRLKVATSGGFGVRHFQTIMCFTCLVFAYGLRVNLSVAIVAMTDKKTADSGIKVLPWDIAQKGVILSSMFWGYVILQIPAGHLSRIIGSKTMLFWSMVFCSIVTIFTPFISLNCDWLVFCFSRFLQGLGQGFFFPCLNTHISKWATSQERNRVVGFVYVGGQVGATLTMFVAGYLAASSWRWPSIFYVTGSCGLLWALMWLYVGADDPDSHSTISDGERAYIKSSLVNSSDQSKKMKTPWKQIMTSAPVLALVACGIGQLWSYWTLVTMLPLYFGHVLGFDIKNASQTLR
ncbi:putative inorganic phosphate cotransporter [Homalodisca vitripennis]|uniref:putative inorganic phosphate cotransporter n=1 Tax=Homalodisca vitripennis TaxID=197043 RepID=UPI001EEAD98D|nr:putative inorganic phosphate cotransporter [Homalodisca vitripennis]